MQLPQYTRLSLGDFPCTEVKTATLFFFFFYYVRTIGNHRQSVREPRSYISNQLENMQSTYTPYSLRHNITDPDLAGLLDYLERVMGWEVSLLGDYRESIFISNRDTRKETPYRFIIRTFEGISPRVYCKSDDGILFEKMHIDIFYSTYRTLLPVIRDLYSK